MISETSPEVFSEYRARGKPWASSDVAPKPNKMKKIYILNNNSIKLRFKTKTFKPNSGLRTSEEEKGIK